MSRPRRLTLSACGGGFLLATACALVAYSQTQPDGGAAESKPEKKITLDTPPPEGKNPAEKAVYAALDEAIKLLEERKYPQFLLHYMPVDDLRKIRKEGLYKATFRMMGEPREVQRLIRYLKLARRSQPKFYESNMVVGFQFDAANADEQVQALEEAVRVDVTANVEGYGDDLSAALKSGARALEDGSYKQFITRMFPAGEVNRMQAKGTVEDVILRISENEAMIKQMTSDLQALAKETPKYNKDKTVASFEFGEDKPGKHYRKYRFEKVGGNWRFSNEAAKVRKQIDEMKKNSPGGVELSIQLERLGDAWRLYKMPG